MLLFLAVLDISLLFAETYQWTDANGTVHFSDTPPSGKQSKVKRHDTSDIPSISTERTTATTSAGKRQSAKEPSWKPDAPCLQEMKSYENNLKQKMEISKRCTDSVTRKSRQVFSPKCLKLIESFPVTDQQCQQEMQRFSQAQIEGLQQCNNETLNSSTISANCMEQLERFRKSGHAWSDLFQ